MWSVSSIRSRRRGRNTLCRKIDVYNFLCGGTLGVQLLKLLLTRFQRLFLFVTARILHILQRLYNSFRNRGCILPLTSTLVHTGFLSCETIFTRSISSCNSSIFLFARSAFSRLRFSVIFLSAGASPSKMMTGLIP